MDTMKERVAEQQAKYDAMCNLGADHGLRIGIQWLDCERIVHSWEALAALMGKKASTLRSYRSRDQLSYTTAKHPEWPHHFSDCKVVVYEEAKRGPPPSPNKAANEAKREEARAKKKALARQKLEMKLEKLRLETKYVETQLEQI